MSAHAIDVLAQSQVKSNDQQLDLTGKNEAVHDATVLGLDCIWFDSLNETLD